MVNNKEFANRLKKIMEFHQFTASSFADKIGVQRSSISHVLSGRNKPSLDFILKVTNVFKEVDLYWLLNGKGIFPKKDSSPSTPSILESNTTNLKETLSIEKATSKKIQKIVVFYEDGTFDEFLKN